MSFAPYTAHNEQVWLGMYLGLFSVDASEVDAELINRTFTVATEATELSDPSAVTMP